MHTYPVTCPTCFETFVFGVRYEVSHFNIFTIARSPLDFDRHHDTRVRPFSLDLTTPPTSHKWGAFGLIIKRPDFLKGRKSIAFPASISTVDARILRILEDCRYLRR